MRDQLPAYFVYEHGVKTARVTDIHSLWQEDSVCFYLGTIAVLPFFPPISTVVKPLSFAAPRTGCSFSFENALVSASVPVRNAEQGKNVSMYLYAEVAVLKILGWLYSTYSPRPQHRFL